jgi:ATP-dependent Clp protease protease subunit
MQRVVDIDHRIKPKIATDLLDLPQIVRVTKFDEAAAEKFTEEIDKAASNGQPVVPVIVDSYGGQVYSLLTMISVIEQCPIPVATICVGKAMSCGSILMSCGADGLRFMDKNATIMVHDVSSMEWGKTQEVKAGAAENERLSKLVFGIMARNCGHKADHFLKILHDKSHSEWYLTATEAKKQNIVNHIRVPKFSVKVSVDVVFE